MNRIRTIPIRLIIVALVGILLLVALIGPSGNGASSSAGQAAITRLPRPHPQSQRLDVDASHVETLYPRPHPQSHIRTTITKTPIGQP
jgi:hypothetical protein